MGRGLLKLFIYKNVLRLCFKWIFLV